MGINIKHPLLVFGIVHWGLIAVLVVLLFIVWKVSWEWILIGLLLYFVFFVVVVVRLLRHYYHFPIPSVMTRFIDNPLRRKFWQNPDAIAEHMHL
ncbi:MAG: hypothetical protein LUQ65_09605, partial [Candidatus Helarchaeota archaeon]|nr:hypothetical protein [Candidatus Helarchaeota archaeon]